MRRESQTAVAVEDEDRHVHLARQRLDLRAVGLAKRHPHDVGLDALALERARHPPHGHSQLVGVWQR